MKVLVTSAASQFGATIADLLEANHDVVRTDLPDRSDGAAGVVACDLRHDEATDRLVSGCDAVVHPGFPGVEGGHAGDATELIDYHTRRTYNLLMACVSQGTRRFVNLSTLRLMEDYGEHLAVSERWKPLPSTDPDILAADLCEYVCREFARDRGVEVANLRLGFPFVKGGRAEATAAGSSAVSSKDLGAALEAALVANLDEGLHGASAPKGTGWRVIHVQSPAPGARFLMGTAERVLGYPTTEAANS
ncbi:MAG: NAD-dependent epimerase/dehydratase family protein [Chloroflexota bacterium]